MFVFFMLLFFPSFAKADDCSLKSVSCSSNDTYCLLVDQMDRKANYLVCHEKIDTASDDGLCSGTQQTSDGFYNEGQFGGLDQRNQESVYILAFLYQEPDSAYYKNTCLLNRVVLGLDYLRRAQSDGGGISENGWMGIDYNDVDCNGDPNDRGVKNNSSTYPSSCDCSTSSCDASGYLEDPSKGSGTSVSGFTYYASAQAINLLYNDSNFISLLKEKVRASGDGEKNDLRSKVYTYLIASAAHYLTNNGRGHAPNQDLIALSALYALNEAYDKLESLGYSVADADLDKLMDDLDLNYGDTGYDSTTSLSNLRQEIFYGSSDEAVDANGFNRWFSDKSLLFEKGYRSTEVKETDSHSLGYDGGYGWVALRALALLKNKDVDINDFLENYVNWFQYFFYVDLKLEKGGYQVSAISRRQYQEGEPKLAVSGLLQGYPAMKTIFNATLEHFLYDPDAYFGLPSSDDYTGSYVIPELLLNWKTPSSSDYVLPLNRFDDGDGSDFENYEDVMDDSTGSVITLLEITNTDDTLEGVEYSVNDWWNGQKTYYYADSTATITIPMPEYAPCNLCPGSSTFTCADSDGKVLEEIVSTTASTSKACKSATSLTLKVSVTQPTDASFNVDSNNDDTPDHFDDDEDNYCEGDFCVDETNPGDCDDTDSTINPGATEICDDGIDQNCDGEDTSCDTDGDGLPDSEESILGTDPSNPNSDDDGLSDGDEVNTYGTDPLDSDSDNDGLSDGKEVEAGSDPTVFNDWLNPILSFIMETDDDGDGADSVADGGDDCDDTNSSVHVGAAEICGDSIDQDCDGSDTTCATPAITYTVNTTADTNDGKCTETNCTFREALALAKADTTEAEIDIEFSIPTTDSGCNLTTGVCTIYPTKALPVLARGNTIINGFNLIIIDGTYAGSSTKGITINNSSSNIIENIGIQNFGNHGVYITGSSSSDNEISGCYIGVDSLGADQSNGGSGIYTTSGADTVISKNIIAYNANKGVQLTTTSTIRNMITQNSMFSNVSYGITLSTSANNSKAKPVISAATVSGSTVTIIGTATVGDVIEIFNASVDSEGQTYIGETTTDSSGNWAYVTNTTITPKWSKVITTATDTTNGTSPFSVVKTVK